MGEPAVVKDWAALLREVADLRATVTALHRDGERRDREAADLRAAIDSTTEAVSIVVSTLGTAANSMELQGQEVQALRKMVEEFSSRFGTHVRRYELHLSNRHGIPASDARGRNG